MKTVYDVIDRKSGKVLMASETCYNICKNLDLSRKDFLDALDGRSKRFYVSETEVSYDKSCASRLQYLIAKKRMSNGQLAQKLGVSHMTVCGWLYFDHYPSALNLVNIADLFNTSIDFIMGRVDHDG